MIDVATLPSLVILGAGGHAKVLLGLLRDLGANIAGVCDPQLASQGLREWRGLPVLGGDNVLEALDPAGVALVNGVGQVVGGRARQRIFELWHARGFDFPTLIHPFAWVDLSVQLAPGVQVMAGAVIQADVRIGANSIVNTKASIDHDCVVGHDVHIAPGATVCGGVRVADQAFVASGATVIQGLLIGEGAVVGAGTTLTKDLAAGLISFGPGRIRPLRSDR
ncbi:acetyltransferase [Pseudomonas sp. LFM046]|uniref:acetyltransferase n=1 Tax=Pseudomonas sp. LFM046 TaxID=1608357 RepID=UPI0005CFA3FC|nr:acetyltransferase [Pseudomonas sp. LFM046]